MDAVIKLDAQRLLCPLPVIRLSEAVEQAGAGQQIEITCTDPGVQQDIPAWCRVHGHELLEIEIADEHQYICRVRVNRDE